MSEVKDFPHLVEQAENAVAAVKDPELKRIAFQKILESLLSGQRDEEGTAKVTVRPKQVRVRHRTGTGKAKGGPAIYLQELIDEGFFKKPKTISQVKAELENRGHHIPMTSLSGPLQKKCQERQLRRQKVKTSGKKETFAYSDW